MRVYTKEINGELVYKNANDISIECNGFLYVNPNHEEILDDGWDLYSEEEEDKEKERIKNFENSKNEKLNEIETYASSDYVKKFYFCENQMWFDDRERLLLKMRLEAELHNNVEFTKIWYNGVCYTLKVSDALNMLFLIELYSSQCYDATQTNLYNIKQITLNNEMDLHNYNYKVNYPQILTFNIESQ